jgi:hypothetical protein
MQAVQKVRDDLLDKWHGGDYVGLASDALKILKGSRPMREYLDNREFLQWTAGVFVLMLVGQAALLGFMGRQVRLMALIFPRRPLGPVILGVGGVAFGVPILAALCLSLVGLPVAVALWTFFYMAAVLGKMGVFLSIGWSISRAFGGGQGVFSMFVVYTLYSLMVVLDPFAIGRAFFVLANLLGIGLAIRTRFGFGVSQESITSRDD